MQHFTSFLIEFAGAKNLRLVDCSCCHGNPGVNHAFSIVFNWRIYISCLASLNPYPANVENRVTS